MSRCTCLFAELKWIVCVCVCICTIGKISIWIERMREGRWHTRHSRPWHTVLISVSFNWLLRFCILTNWNRTEAKKIYQRRTRQFIIDCNMSKFYFNISCRSQLTTSVKINQSRSEKYALILSVFDWFRNFFYLYTKKYHTWNRQQQQNKWSII